MDASDDLVRHPPDRDARPDPRASLPPAGRLDRPHSTSVDEELANRTRRLPARSASTPAPSRPGRRTCAACWSSRSSACCSSTRCSDFRRCCRTRSGLPPVPEGLAFNTAVSFVTNTNWQSYSPELTMGYTVQLAGLAVQNFVSAAVGIAVAIALVRGFAAADRRPSATSGSTSCAGSPASCCRCRSSRRSRSHRRRRPELQRLHRCPRPSRAARRCCRAVRSRRRRRSRSSARTAAASSTPTPPIRSRTRRRGRTCCEILLLLAIPFSLPRAFGRSSATTARATRSSRSWPRSAIVSIAALSWLESLGIGAAPQLAGGGDGGQGAALRHPRIDLVRRCHHAHLDGRRQLDARLVHGARRHDPDDQHDARRSRPRRHGLGTVRDAGARGHRRVRRRTARRPHARVPRQEDRSARDQAREPLHPGDAATLVLPAPR